MNIVLKELSGKNKESILKEISQIASEETGINACDLLEGFKKREEQTSTGMIDAIAIPHTMQQIENPLLVVGKFQPIADWETLDSSNVELAIAIIAPKDGEEHLKILSQISRKLINSENIALLKNVQKVEEISEILEV